MTDEVRQVEQAAVTYNRLRDELARVIVGQHEAIEQVMVALFAGGHALLEGVPGLAKTMLVRSIAQTLTLTFKRIQFTPDLMPSDVTGTEVLQAEGDSGRRGYQFLPGPIFANLVLADEINRTPPKTQAAMLEAMQERQVTAGGKLYALPQPFLVLATQNPIEQEGTYPLPEAQLDRFLLQVVMDYPDGAEEWEIARRFTGGELPELEPCVESAQVLAIQRLVRRVPISDQVLGYTWRLVRATRPRTPEAVGPVSEWVTWGAGPRGLLAILSGAKARAVLYGRYHATMEDIQALARPALRHRLLLSYAARAEGVTPDRVVDRILELVPQDAIYEAPQFVPRG
ncbi:MAG: MoxR family ATPase [Pirellulales bacterium]